MVVLNGKELSNERYYLGSNIAKIGAHLWESNSKMFGDDVSYNEQEKDLNRMGRLGFHMCVCGLKILKIKPEDVENIIKEANT